MLPMEKIGREVLNGMHESQLAAFQRQCELKIDGWDLALEEDH